MPAVPVLQACNGRPLPDLEPGKAPADPLALGRHELTATLGEVGCGPAIDVLLADDPQAQAALAEAGARLDPRPESFAIVPGGRGTLVIGRDPVGALYGSYQAAELLRLEGVGALPPARPVLGAPAVAIRAANLFLTLPAEGEPYWWFLDERYWNSYLDMMVRSRLNVLDLHGMFLLKNTLFPNALLYLASSPSYPHIGIAAADRARNVAMLARVVQMAAARGIRTAFMSYHASPALDGGRDDWKLDSEELKRYTREAVADLARHLPGLWRLGFRIGESGQPAQWYLDSFVAGLRDSGSTAQPYTRTWGTSKRDVLSLVAGGGDYLVEAKFNGEQLGAPYAIAGGAFVEQGWTNYSYEDYLSAPAPYQFVFQVRTCSTHRIFRYASFERTRRVIDSLHLGLAQGFSLEAAHDYYPARDYYHQNADRFAAWTFQRDYLQYALFGRLGYDPTTPERVFRSWVERRTGSAALWDAMQAASEIVPWIQTANTCGPDTRDFAPELELGGTTAFWARTPGAIWERNACSRYRGPFDSFSVAAPAELAADLAAGQPTARLSPLEVARLVSAAAAQARGAEALAVDPDSRMARDIVRECVALADLGDYFSHKLRSATALAIHQRTALPDYLAAARSETQEAGQAWIRLAQHTGYIAAFPEGLRMGLVGLGDSFHWRFEIPRLADDPASIDAVAAAVAKAPPAWRGSLPAPGALLYAERPEPPTLTGLEVWPFDPGAPVWTITARFQSPLPPGATVTLLWKPVSGFASWSRLPLPPAADGSYATSLAPGGRGGGLFAVEVNAGGAAWRLPDVLHKTPYVALPPR